MREYTDEQRHRRMVADKLRKMGRPVRILPHEFALAEAKIQSLHQQGMSLIMLHERTGIGTRTIGRIVFEPSGAVKTLLRECFDRLMALEFEPPGADVRGARLSPVPARRRLQALWLAGYSQSFQAEWMGTTVQVVSKIIREETVIIHADFNRRIAEMYDKLIYADPTDFGLDATKVKRTQTHASGRGFAPAHCWDEDTIDRLDAHPEWTGACGTRHGRTIHKREGIPMCAACKRSRYTEPPAAKLVLDREELERHIAAWDGTLRSLAAEMDMHVDSLSGWRNGQRSPSPEALEKLAGVLGVHSEELIKR
jgi:hypothetical protein